MQWLQITRFLVVGIGTNVLNIMVFYLLILIHAPVIVASAMGYMCGGILGFNLNKKWTFSHGTMINKGKQHGALSYALLQIVTLGFYVACFSFLDALVGGLVPYLLILLSCVAVSAICNFCLLKFVWSKLI